MRKQRFTVATACGLGLLLAIAGCAGQNSAPTRTPTMTKIVPPPDTDVPSSPPVDTPTPTPSMVGKAAYDSIDAFKDAVEAAGVDCADWSVANQVPMARASGVCGGTVGLSVYRDRSDRNHVLQLNADSSEGMPFLVGENWLLTVQDPKADNLARLNELKARLGGAVWNPGDPIPQW